MPPNPIPPYWIRTTPARSVPVTQPPVDVEAFEPDEPDEPASASRWTSHPSLLLFLGVFLVATICVNLWPDEGHVASSSEAGLDAETVVASLLAERSEHAALAAGTRERASSATNASANAETRTQSPGGKAGPKDTDGETAATEPSKSVGEGPTPSKGNLTLPIVGETPLSDPGLPEVPVVELPAVPETPTLPELEG